MTVDPDSAEQLHAWDGGRGGGGDGGQAIYPFRLSFRSTVLFFYFSL